MLWHVPHPIRAGIMMVIPSVQAFHMSDAPSAHQGSRHVLETGELHLVVFIVPSTIASCRNRFQKLLGKNFERKVSRRRCRFQDYGFLCAGFPSLAGVLAKINLVSDSCRGRSSDRGESSIGGAATKKLQGGSVSLLDLVFVCAKLVLDMWL